MKAWQIAVGLVALEVLLVALFISDPENWDCGGQCSVYSKILVVTIWAILACLVLLLLRAIFIRLGRRRRE